MTGDCSVFHRRCVQPLLTNQHKLCNISSSLFCVFPFTNSPPLPPTRLALLFFLSLSCAYHHSPTIASVVLVFMSLTVIIRASHSLVVVVVVLPFCVVICLVSASLPLSHPPPHSPHSLLFLAHFFLFEEKFISSCPSSPIPQKARKYALKAVGKFCFWPTTRTFSWKCCEPKELKLVE